MWYQGGSTLAHFKSQFKIWSTVDPQNHHMLSSCMHCSLVVSDICVNRPGICLSAGYTISLLNTYIHIAAFLCSRAQSFSTFCNFLWHFCAYLDYYFHVWTLFSFMDFHLWMSLTWYLCVKCMHTSYTCTPI